MTDRSTTTGSSPRRAARHAVSAAAAAKDPAVYSWSRAPTCTGGMPGTPWLDTHPPRAWSTNGLVGRPT